MVKCLLFFFLFLPFSLYHSPLDTPSHHPIIFLSPSFWAHQELPLAVAYTWGWSTFIRPSARMSASLSIRFHCLLCFSVCLSICLFGVTLSVYFSVWVCLFVNVSFCLFIFSFIFLPCLSASSAFYISAFRTICLFISPPVFLPNCFSTFLSVCLSAKQRPLPSLWA